MSKNGDHFESSRLAILFGVGTQREIGWLEDDLRDLLQHQLEMPLAKELYLEASQLRALELAGSDSVQQPLRTFGDLLTHDAPPVWLLESVKEFAKTADSRHDHPLPEKIATALYYLTIASALVRLKRQITSISEDGIFEGLTWLIRQTWVGAREKRLATQATEGLIGPKSL